MESAENLRDTEEISQKEEISENFDKLNEKKTNEKNRQNYFIQEMEKSFRDLPFERKSIFQKSFHEKISEMCQK